MDYSSLANKYGGTSVNQNLSIGVDYSSLAKKYGAVQPEEQKKTLGGFVGNILPSAGNLASGLFEMVVHPIRTLQGFGNVLKGSVSPSVAGEEFVPGTTPEKAQAGEGIKPIEQSKSVQTVDALAQYFSERYGGKNPKEIANAVANTAYKDPVGFAFDLSILLEGGGGALAKVGKVSGLEKVAKAGEVVSKVGEVINPVTQGAKATLRTAKAVAPLVKGAPELGRKLATFGTSQATGLSPSSIREVIANPENFSPAAMRSLTREGLAEEAISKINSRMKALEETGKEYAGIRNSPNPIKIQPNLFAQLIEDTTGLTIDYGGKITGDALSQIRTPSDIAKLQTIYDRYSPIFKQGEITPAEFLNLRTDLAGMAKFEGGIGRSKPLENLSGIIRGKLNTAVRPSIEGLEDLDKVFGAETAELKAIKRDYFNANGTLKDNAVSKIANLTGKGKEAVLGRMEKVVPGITEKVTTLKAIEDIQLAAGQKVGAYSRAFMLGGGILTLNSAVIIAAVLSSPEIAVQILRGYGKLLKVKDANLQKIIAEYERVREAVKADPEKGAIRNPFVEESKSVAKAPAFKGFEDLSTKLVEDLKGRDVVNKKYVEQRMVSSDLNLKQVEKDLVKKVLDTYKDEKISVQDLAEKIKDELLPLKRVSSLKEGGNFARYESITLPGELKGNVARYSENVYQSPIKTSAGQTHFSTLKHDNYFGHTRIEDMAVDKQKGGFPKTPSETRRVIEVQSDLYQKGNLENEAIPKELQMAQKRLSDTMSDLRTAQEINPEEVPKLQESVNKWQAQVDKLKNPNRAEELSKLQQYNDPTAHFRMVREEVRQAAIDGKTKLQFPTGETAMKIEGLGENAKWTDISKYVDGDEAIIAGEGELLRPSDLKIGQRVSRVDNDNFGTFDPNDSWIVTDVLGDGKFKAVPKNAWEIHQKDLLKAKEKSATELSKSDYEQELNAVKEQFDISGKVDTNNPIYKFYEKDLGRYLRTNYGAELFKDKQGVDWWQIDITPEMKKAPVNAFGMIKGKNVA